ncbi:MAG: fluoride exporter [Actinomycetota bacterium]|nr:fluoride exporter [Actinomycetota bacterium]MEA2581583.1 fluoride exporter [Actinomycetota bacterium]
MRNLVAIAVFGALGALGRYGADRWISERLTGGFPWGIFIINVVGSFLIGVLWITVVQRQGVSLWVKSAGTTGFLGAFTTFSTFSLLTVEFLEDRAYALAFANSFGSLTAGIAGAWLGLVVGRALV